MKYTRPPCQIMSMVMMMVVKFSGAQEGSAINNHCRGQNPLYQSCLDITVKLMEWENP